MSLTLRAKRTTICNMRADDIPPITASQFRTWRLDRDWTIERAAKWLQVPTPTYRNWEQGHRSPDNPGPIRKLMGKAPKRKVFEDNDPQLL